MQIIQCQSTNQHMQGSSRTGTPFPFLFIQRERRSRYFLYNGNAVPFPFYTTETSFPLFFSLYTPIVNCDIKISAHAECTKMHQCQTKKFLETGQSPSPDPFPTGEGIPPLQTPPSSALSALGVPVPFHLRLEH